MDFSLKFLKEALTYNEKTGEFIWNERPSYHFKRDCDMKTFNTKYAGKAAGNKNKSLGYVLIDLKGKPRLAHRLAWFYVYGVEPSEIDHINHERSDNRISNLRDVTRSQNSKNRPLQSNNKSGHHGISFDKDRGKWRAEIKIDGKNKFLGRFDVYEDAVRQRVASEKYYDFHMNHGG